MLSMLGKARKRASILSTLNSREIWDKSITNKFQSHRINKITRETIKKNRKSILLDKIKME